MEALKIVLSYLKYSSSTVNSLCKQHPFKLSIVFNIQLLLIFILILLANATGMFIFDFVFSLNPLDDRHKQQQLQ